MIKRIAFGLMQIGLLILVPSGATQAQDISFAQFYNSPLYVNPALAGTASDGAGGSPGRVAGNYRNQIVYYPNFVTGGVSYDQHIEKLNAGIGLLVVNDRANYGVWSTSALSFQYSQYVKLNENWSARIGAEIQVSQRQFDWTKLRWFSQEPFDYWYRFVDFNWDEFFTEKTKMISNFSVGGLVYSDHWYGGFAVHNLTQPDQGYYSNRPTIIPRRYTFHAGSVFPLGSSPITWSPNILIKTQGQFKEGNVGCYINRRMLITGIWYKHREEHDINSDGLMLLLGVKLKRYRLGYSFDFAGQGNLARSTPIISHELSGSFIWSHNKIESKHRKMPMPW